MVQSFESCVGCKRLTERLHSILLTSLYSPRSKAYSAWPSNFQMLGYCVLGWGLIYVSACLQPASRLSRGGWPVPDQMAGPIEDFSQMDASALHMLSMASEQCEGGLSHGEKNNAVGDDSSGANGPESSAHKVGWGDSFGTAVLLRDGWQLCLTCSDGSIFQDGWRSCPGC